MDGLDEHHGGGTRANLVVHDIFCHVIYLLRFCIMDFESHGCLGA